MIGPFEHVPAIQLGIGESPVWDACRRRLWFVDILRPTLCWFDPSDDRFGSYAMPAPVGCVALAGDTRLVLGLKTGVHLFEPDSGALAFLVHPEPKRTMNRLNDGRIGPDGAFWVGSMHDSVPRAPTGALYRVTADGACSRVLDGLHVSNGLAWSPDGRTMYHSDSRVSTTRGRIDRYEFDPRSGALGPASIFAILDESEGLPDGAAVDQDGVYWSAGVTAGCLNAFSAKGELIRKVHLPTPAPTMPCLGGDDLSTLFVTSLARGRPERAEPGLLLRAATDLRGLPEPRFGSPAESRSGDGAQA